MATQGHKYNPSFKTNANVFNVLISKEPPAVFKLLHYLFSHMEVFILEAPLHTIRLNGNSAGVLQFPFHCFFSISYILYIVWFSDFEEMSWKDSWPKIQWNPTAFSFIALCTIWLKLVTEDWRLISRDYIRWQWNVNKDQVEHESFCPFLLGSNLTLGFWHKNMWTDKSTFWVNEPVSFKKQDRSSYLLHKNLRLRHKLKLHTVHILLPQPYAFTASEFRRADREHEREKS